MPLSLVYKTEKTMNKDYIFQVDERATRPGEIIELDNKTYQVIKYDYDLFAYRLQPVQGQPSKSFQLTKQSHIFY